MKEILDAYDLNKNKYESFAKTLRSTISGLMLTDGIKTHSISSRVKSRESLEGKVNIKGDYNCIEDITDVIGVRIITHFSDEVDTIAKIIEREFSIDSLNSIDKRATLEPDRFGYLSLHYVLSLSENRVTLPENKPYEGLKAEIQIRSILQHTWAEIEHDIGYKSSIEVPVIIKRKFSRLAGLLELADEEFVSIRTSLSKYKEEVSVEIEKGNSNNITIDKITMREYLIKSPVIKSIRKTIKDRVGVVFNESSISGTSALKHLQYHNIHDINALDKAFIQHKELVIKRALEVISRASQFSDAEVSIDLLVVYLSQVMAAKNSNIDEILEFVDFVQSYRKMKDPQQFAQRLLDLYQ